jgi:hypothetical protein
MKNYNKKFFFASIIIILWAILTHYFIQIFTSIILLNILILYFWQEKKPPVILGALTFQWLSVSIGFYYLALSNKTPEILLARPLYSIDNLNKAFFLGTIAIFSLATGIKLAITNLKFDKLSDDQIKKFSYNKLVIAYLFFDFVVPFLFKKTRSGALAGLSQAITILSLFRWSLLFIIIYLTKEKKQYRLKTAILILFDISLGFTGYFSNFKDYILFLILAYLCINKLKTKQFFFALIIGIFTLILGSFWSYFKGEYRQFLSGGEQAQVVTVSKTSALSKLFSYIPQFNKDKFEIGTETLVKRIFYLEFFSATIKNIPKYDPYMNGKNWNQAILHVLMPRFFFPNKPAIDDSKHTFALTRIKVANASKGTSISVGYAADSYADFGPFFMFLPIFIFGFMLGLYYKFLVTHSPGIWSYAFIFPIFFLINFFERDIIKIIGDTFWFFIVFWFLNKFIPTIEKILKSKNYANN